MGKSLPVPDMGPGDDEPRDAASDKLIKSLLEDERAAKMRKKEPAAASVPSAPAAKRGKTLAQIEAEEGGPIKESLVGMAHTKRALDRKDKKGADVGDTDAVASTERYEQEGLEVEEEGGVKFEPFNLKQEREEGYFDADGNYVLRKPAGGEEGEEKDAWLDSEEAKVVSDAIRAKIEAERARDEADARRAPLTERQIAQKKADMAALMQPSETVTRALKRLGAAGTGGAGGGPGAGKALGKRERARLLAQHQQQQQQQAAAAGTEAGPSGAAAAVPAGAFTQLTELADELLGEGELEIYGATREELLRSARMWLPQLAAPAAAGAGAAAAGPSGAGAGAGGGAAAQQGAAAAAGATDADGDEDMFGGDDDDDEGDKRGGSGGGAKAAAAAAAAGAAPAAAVKAMDGEDDMFADDGDGDDRDGKAAAKPAAAAPAPAAPSTVGAAAAAAAAAAPPPPHPNGGGAAASASKAGGEEVDYGSWPIKELKRLLQERGVDPAGLVEKADLVARVKEVLAAGSGAAAGPGPGSSSAPGGAAAFEAPPGYAFDPNSSYFYNPEAGMYFDPATGAYGQATTGLWYVIDPATGQFVDYKPAAS